MSTNRTEHYQLHAWEPGDTFLREEFNENFAKLDAATRIVTGTYSGNGTASRFISLGFTPQALLIDRDHGRRDQFFTGGGLVLPGLTSINGAVSVTEEGFQVTKEMNEAGSFTTVYFYLALR